MKWQSPVTLAAVLLVAGCQGAPQHIVPAAPQVLYQPLPQHRQSANVVIVPGNTAGIQQFAAAGVPLPVGGQYLLVQPGAPVLYMTRAEGGDKPTEGGSGGGGGFLTEWFNNVLSWAPFGSTTTPKPAEGEATTEGTTNKKPEEKPIKVVEGSSGEESKPANLETLDEDVPAQPNPSVPVLPAPGQRVVVIGQPQFFGSYDALRNPAIQQSLSTSGAVSSFLILKGQQAADGKVQEEELQKYMAGVKDAQQQPVVASPAAYQNLVYLSRQQAIDDDKASVVVEALAPRPVKTKQGEGNEENEEEEDEGEDVVADPPGPSVAQVKPQAIALAGPGGVAAAAPVGTALVGPGGFAVAAPSATAVAGPSGGAMPAGSGALSSPAALKAYILEQQNRGAPVVNPAASYQLTYNY